jgi:hypothetical protein
MRFAPETINYDLATLTREQAARALGISTALSTRSITEARGRLAFAHRHGAGLIRQPSSAVGKSDGRKPPSATPPPPKTKAPSPLPRETALP